ncbi:hypothetical protein ACOME3_008370 [Neoechinorhynchus agilis]
MSCPTSEIENVWPGQHHQQPEVIVLRSPTIRPEICKRPTITQEQRSKLAQTVHLLELMMHREQVEMRRLALVGLMYEEKCRIEREKECEFAERGMRLRSSSVIGEISRIVTPYIEFDGFNALAEKYRRKRMGKRFNGLVENHIDAKIPRNEYGNETKPHSSKVTCTGWTYLPVFLVQPSDPSDVFSADELLLIRRMSETTSDSKSVNTVAEDIKFF